MSKQMTLEECIAEFEIQLSFQEDHLEKLNDALVDQQSRIETLERVVRHYEKRLEEMQQGLAGDEPIEPELPPHY